MIPIEYEGIMQPQPKVLAAGVAGALTTILVYILGTQGVAIPADVAAAITTVISFVAGYFTSNN